MLDHIQCHLIYSLGKAGKANSHSLEYIMLWTQQSYSRNIRGPLIWPLYGLKGNTLYIAAPFRGQQKHICFLVQSRKTQEKKII